MLQQFWGLPKTYILDLVKESEKNLTAVQNRLYRFGTYEMNDIADFIGEQSNREYILGQ